MSTKFISDLGPEYFVHSGIFREPSSEEEREERRKILKIFEQDCKKILSIFAEYWRDYSECSDSEKSAFLKREMLQAYPDLLTCLKREEHILMLMDWLMQEGHLLLPKPNRTNLRANCSLLYDIEQEEIFDAWAASDVEAWCEAMRQRYEAQRASNVVGCA